MTLLRCERCHTADATVCLCRAATAFHDPTLNRSMLMCAFCAEEYYAYWEEQWREYNNSRGI